MAQRVVQWLALLRTAKFPSQSGSLFRYFPSHAAARTSPVETVTNAIHETTHIGRFVRQLLQPSAPTAARHVRNPGAFTPPRLFGTAAGGGAFSRAGGGKRFQYTDARGVTHFRPRGFRRLHQDPDRRRRFLIVIGVGGGAFYIYYRSHLEEVPYTHRKHFVAISPATERALGEQQFQQIKLQFAPDILPNSHPITRRVRKISARIIDAAISGVNEPPQNERDGDGNLIIDWAPPPSPEKLPSRKKRPRPVPEPGESDPVFRAHRHEEEFRGLDREMMDDGVHGAPDKGGGGGYTAHLNGLKWEVIVVNKDILNAFCLPGGKIVVFTGLIKHFPEDEEIATVLGHEVGHSCARHVGEKLSSGFLLGILELVIVAAGIPIEVVIPASQAVISLPNSRKLESEADKIGLILMAAAGFDPRVAPSFYERMGTLEGQPEYMQYLSTHPAGRARARMLAQAKVMEEAVEIYERTREKQAQEKEKTFFRPAWTF